MATFLRYIIPIHTLMYAKPHMSFCRQFPEWQAFLPGGTRANWKSYNEDQSRGIIVIKAGRDANAQEPDETETNKVRTALEDFLTCLGTYCQENFMLSSIGTEEYPNFHGNTRLAQTQSYFNLTGNSHIVHSLDVEMDSSNWNLHGHSVDVLYPTGLRG